MRIQAQGRIPADHPSLAGHFPGNPIVPGVLLLHELLATIQDQWNVAPGPIYWSAVKFTASLRPEEPFVMTVETTDGERIVFAITRGDTTIASGSLRYPPPGRGVLRS
jgi:3-hydroxyacyl-[acyl-carrier-protein] dehydratase